MILPKKNVVSFVLYSFCQNCANIFSRNPQILQNPRFPKQRAEGFISHIFCTPLLFRPFRRSFRILCLPTYLPSMTFFPSYQCSSTQIWCVVTQDIFLKIVVPQYAQKQNGKIGTIKYLTMIHPIVRYFSSIHLIHPRRIWTLAWFRRL